MVATNSWTGSRVNVKNIFSTGKAEEKTCIKKILRNYIRRKDESKKIETIKLENKAIKQRRDEIEKEMKKLEKEDKNLLQQLTKNIDILKKIGEIK